MRLSNYLKAKSVFKKPLAFYWDNIRKKDGNLSYAMKDGNVFTIRSMSDDRYILNEIYVRNVYLQGIVLPPEAVIVDIGAHIGIFSCKASKLYPSATIYSYEPEYTNFSRLQEHISRNKCNNVQIFNYAVSEYSGNMKLHIGSDTGRHSLLGTGKYEEVRSVTLKQILKDNHMKKIDLLKMDCEGAEYGILKSSKEILRKINMIVLEWHGNFNGCKEDIIDFLLENGFWIKEINDNILQAARRNEVLIHVRGGE